MFFQEAAKAFVSAVDPPSVGAKDGSSVSGWSTYGTFGGKPGSNAVVRFLLWAAQYAVHTFFLTYAGSAFVQIGDLVVNGRSISMWERISTIYGKLYVSFFPPPSPLCARPTSISRTPHPSTRSLYETFLQWAGHVLALLAFAASFALAPRKAKAKAP